jgi:hypothetical protein
MCGPGGSGSVCRAGRAAGLAALTLLAGACDGTSGAGAGLAGIYEAQDDSRDTIEFRRDRVYVTFSPAPTMVGHYEIDGDKVILTMSGGGGQSIVLTRKGDALEGAPFRKALVRK